MVERNIGLVDEDAVGAAQGNGYFGRELADRFSEDNIFDPGTAEVVLVEVTVEQHIFAQAALMHGSDLIGIEETADAILHLLTFSQLLQPTE